MDDPPKTGSVRFGYFPAERDRQCSTNPVLTVQQSRLIDCTYLSPLENTESDRSVRSLCCLWLRAATALDETNDRADYSKIDEQSFIRSERLNRSQSTEIGNESESVVVFSL